MTDGLKSRRLRRKTDIKEAVFPSSLNDLRQPLFIYNYSVYASFKFKVIFPLAAS